MAFTDPTEFIKRTREEREDVGKVDAATGFTDPIAFIMEKRGDEDFRDKRMPFPLDFRRPIESRFIQGRPEEEGFEPLTEGDPEFVLDDYFAGAQTPSAHAEKELYDARQKATRALELDPSGNIFTDEERERLESIATTGEPPEGGGLLGGFMGFLDIIDRPGELIRAGVADLFMDSDEHDTDRGEVTLQDYWDILTGNDEAVRERLGTDLVGEQGNFLFEGRHMLEEMGVKNKWAKGFGGFFLDVALDPLTYVTFGTAGVGRKAAIEATTAVAAGSWKNAIRAVRQGGIDALTDPIEKAAARKLEARIAREVDEGAEELGEKLARTARGRRTEGPLARRDEHMLREAARERVLREEERLVDALGGVSLDEFDEADDLLEQLTKMGDDVPFDSEFAREVGHLAKLQAEKKYKDLADLFPEYVQSDFMPGFAKGGLRVAPSPFGRRNMPMLTIPGTRRNAPGQALIGRIMDKLPDSTSNWLRQMGEDFSTTRRLLNRAKDYDPYAEQVSPYVAVEAATAAFGKTKLGRKLHDIAPELSHTIKEVHDAAAKHGVDAKTVEELIRKGMAGDWSSAAGMPEELVTAALDAAAGVRKSLETVYAAAEQVGMPIQHITDYVPLVSNPSYQQIIEKLARAGHAIPIDEAVDAEERLGLELIAEFAGSTGERAPSAIRQLGESRHARQRIATAAYQAELAGEDVTLLQISEMREALERAGVSYYDHDTLNRAVTKALDRLVEEGKVDPRLVSKLDGEPFWTDLSEILDAYVNSMSEAIRFRDIANRFKTAQLLTERQTRISTTRTLTHLEDAANSPQHPIMQFMDDLASSIEEGAAARVASKAAQRTTVRVVKGWDLEVPAALVGTRRFERALGRLRTAAERTLRNVADSRGAVEAHAQELAVKGVPREIANRVALLDSNADFRALEREIRAVAEEEAATIRQLAAEQMASNAHKLDDTVATEQLQRAAHEAAEIRAGAEETIKDFERQLAERLQIEWDVSAERVIDLTEAGSPMRGDSRSFMQFLADEGDRKLDELISERAAAEGLDVSEEAADEAQLVLAERTVDSMADGPRVVDLTIGDVVTFAGSTKRRAAIALSVLYDKLERAYGREAAEQLMSPELRAAVDDLSNAQDVLQGARNGFEDTTINEAQALVAEKVAIVEEMTQELADSDVLIADVIDSVKQTVSNVEDDALFAPAFDEVRAAALHKLSLMDRSEFAEEMAAQGVKSASQTSIFRQGTKEMMRFAAGRERLGYLEAAAAARNAGDIEEYAAPVIDKAIQALRAGDRMALPHYQGEVRQLVHMVYPQLDANRVFIRPSGAIVYADETVAASFITLDDVIDDLRQIVPDGENMDIPDLVGTAVEAWRAEPEAMEGFSDELAAWFRQLDSEGGFDYDVETYEYLREFVGRLRTVEADLAARQGTTKLTNAELDLARSGLRKFADTPQIIRRNLERLARGEEIPVEVERREAMALAKWWHKRKQGMKGLYRGMEVGNVPEVGDMFEIPIGNASRSFDEAKRFATDRNQVFGENQWVVAFGDGTPAALNPNNTNVPLVSGRFRVVDIDRSKRVIRVSAEHVEDVLPSGAPARLTPAQERAASALNEILNAVGKAARGGEGVGSKALRNTWEKHAHTLKGVLPADVVDQARTLVDFTIGTRALKLPKRILDKQVALRRHIWEPIEDAHMRFAEQTEDLLDEAMERGRADLAEAADSMRHFQMRMFDLASHGENLERGVRAGKEGLVPIDSEFGQAVEATRVALRDAIEQTKKVAKEDRILLDDLIPPTASGRERSLDAWIKDMQKQLDEWEPQTVTAQELEGYVDVASEGIGGNVVKGMIAERHVALVLENMASRLASLTRGGGVRNLVENVDKAVRWWRAAATVGRPTFVPRNLIGGVFNGLIIGVGPRHYAFATRHILPAVRKVRNAHATWDEVIADAAPKARGYLAGIRDSDVLQTSFAVSSLEHLKRGVGLSKRINPASPHNALFYTGARAMEASEDLLRAAAFVAHFDPHRPATARMARALSLAVHFDYQDLTNLESGLLKKLVPFFTWTKNNIPLQLRTMFENPGVYARYRHFVSNLQGAQEEVAQDQFPDSQYRSGLAAPLGIVLGEDGAWWSRAVFDPDLPFRDVEEALGATEEGLAGGLDWALGLAAPQFSAPLDFLTAQDYQVTAPTGLAEIIKFTDPFIPGDVTRTIDDRVMVPGGYASLFRTALPFLQENLQVAGITPSSPRQAARLGVQTADDVQLGERIRQGALRLARAGGLQFQVPGDASTASFLAEQEVFDIQDEARLEGRLIDPDEREAVIDAILARHGLG